MVEPIFCKIKRNLNESMSKINFIFVYLDCDVTDDCFDGEINSAHQQAQVGNLKLDLPLDEDDYLMPSPQLPTNTTQYMDLIGDSKPTGKHETLSLNHLNKNTYSSQTIIIRSYISAKQFSSYIIVFRNGTKASQQRLPKVS